MILHTEKTGIEAIAVELAAVKNFVRLMSDDEDSLVSAMTIAAQDEIGLELSTAFVSTTFRCVVSYANKQFSKVEIPTARISGISEVKTKEVLTGKVRTLLPTEYYFNDLISNKPVLHFIKPQFGDGTPKDMVITYKAGLFATQADVKGSLYLTLLQRIAQLYEYRGEGKGGVPQLKIDFNLRSLS